MEVAANRKAVLRGGQRLLDLRESRAQEEETKTRLCGKHWGFGYAGDEDSGFDNTLSRVLMVQGLQGRQNAVEIPTGTQPM